MVHTTTTATGKAAIVHTTTTATGNAAMVHTAMARGKTGYGSYSNSGGKDGYGSYSNISGKDRITYDTAGRLHEVYETWMVDQSSRDLQHK